MKKKEFYCYSCDNSFIITVNSDEPIKFCCYCSESLEEADFNEEEEDE